MGKEAIYLHISVYVCNPLSIRSTIVAKYAVDF